MFILTTIEDVVPIVPADFGKKSRQVVEDNINHKYANRVIHKVGLCICFYDLISAGDGLIENGASNGTVHVNGMHKRCSDRQPLYMVWLLTCLAVVKFRMLVFRPFRGEIMYAQIAESTDRGIRCA